MSLLLDALERTLTEPGCAHRWHRLTALCAEAADEATRQQVVQILSARPDGAPDADVLRWTFLAGLTRAPHCNAAAAARLLAMQPGDAERLAAFMAFVWLDTLQTGQGRDAFVTALRTARLPALAQRLTTLARPAGASLPTRFPAPMAGKDPRIAIIVPYAGNRLHTPSVMAAEQAALLAGAGCQVRLFSAQELVVPEMKFLRGDAGTPALPPFDPAYWTGVLPPGTDISVADSRYSLERRWRDMLPLLATFNPDIVLLIGLYSPLAAVLHAFRPVVGLSVNSVPPISPVDVWLSAERPETMQAAARLWDDALPPHPVCHPWRMPRPRTTGRLARPALGLPQDATVWVTAGFRLGHEIAGEWAARMLDALAQHPAAFWLLVGGDGQLPPALRDAASVRNRIRALPTRTDMADILPLCDLYINPPRMGGGFSVAEAMAAGLPVLSFADSDGGDKIGDQAVRGMDDYFRRLATLTETPALRTETGQTLQRRFDECFDLAASGPSLLAACRQATALAAGRPGHATTF